MAVYFLHIKTFGRSGGSSAVSAAAYRAGERIRDERTGRTYDHTDRQDIMHKEIVLPTRFADSELRWARDRLQLWNTAESAESRKNATVAREYLVALPIELNSDQRVDLARGFSQELSNRYQFAVDLTVHAPRDFPGSGPRNFHAHLLATTREVTRDGLAAKTALELSDSQRRERGLKPVIHELLFIRQRWATIIDEARRAEYQMPFFAKPLARDGSAASETSRRQAPANGEGAACQPQSVEDIGRQARENWLKMRRDSPEASLAASERGDDEHRSR
jgi:hypothetical protein